MQGPPHPSPQRFHQHPRRHQHAPQRPQPAQPAAATKPTKPTKAYNPRRPERTLLYRTVAEHFVTWLELSSLRAFVARGHLEPHDAKDMAERAASSSHGGGFSVDTGVLIEATDRAGLERLLRYCARPPFAIDRLKQRGADTSTRVNWCSCSWS